MASILDTGMNTVQQLYSECTVFIDKIIQVRHSKTFFRHDNKFNKLKLKQSQGGICNRQFYNNNSTPTNRCYNNMNDNNNHNTSMSDITNKWVVDLSNTPLTDAKISLLARGPKFIIVPWHPTKRDYISAIEEVCQWLPLKVAGEHMADTSKLLGRTHPQDPISPYKKPWPLRNQGQTNPGSFWLWTRGQQWWLWTDKTTITRH